MRYIGIDKIIYHLKDEMECCADKEDDAHQIAYGAYLGLLYAKSLMTAGIADVVEITRCKDCKFYKPYDKPCEDFDGWCLARNCETDEYDFCNYGDEKGGEEK